MRKKLLGMIVVCCQLLIVGFFCVIIFSKDTEVEKNISTVNNENLDKIATSVSLLFKDEVMTEDYLTIEDDVLSELPSVEVISDVDEEEVNDKVDEAVSTPLTSIDATKYINVADMGFKVTENNKQYSLSDYEFDVVVAVVAGEFDKNLNDALAVMSVILNRCDSKSWSAWAGKSPYTQVIKPGQFEVYYAGMYLKYMPGGSQYGKEKYTIAKQAVIDGLNGIRNNNYLGFRAWWITGYSDKYIVYGGNRYGFN